jgi:hypothetical protein
MALRETVQSAGELADGHAAEGTDVARRSSTFPKCICVSFAIGVSRCAERDYSPPTMYRDYAINRELFHWESQSRQTPRQPTVQRYINHRSQGSRILLFVRERKTFELGTQPFTFLGPAEYVEHHGERPVAFTWRLPKPMPEALFETARSVAAA